MDYDCGKDELVPPLLLTHRHHSPYQALRALICSLPILSAEASGKTWASALAMFTVLWSFRWGCRAEVWFFNTSALLFCCWPAQTKVKFRFHHSWEPFTFWFSHWLFDWKHFVFSFPPPGQSHHGFFWNVCQSDHYASSLIIYHWFLSFCYCTVKITYTL